MGKLFKRERGITLIALVITIIVLLILAGISISMLSGDNSLLKRVGEARDKTGIKSLKEEVQAVLMARQINSSTGLENKTLKEDLESGISGATVETIEHYTDVYYLKKRNDYITVYEDGDIEEGKIEIWDGEKIECPEFKKENNIWNWYIYTPSQLKFLADFVNKGNGSTLPDDLKSYVSEAGYKVDDVTMSTETTIYLMNNLDLGARQTDGTLTVGKSWTPIGINEDNVKDKLGIFEGNNYTIKGVYVNRDKNYNGIFGISNTIKNLIVKNSYIKGKNMTGGIVGWLTSGKIENCHNENTTVTTLNTLCGGIGGTITGNIENCTNSGTIIGNEFYIGGIAGAVNKSSSMVVNCNNRGNINGKDQIAGIIGYLSRIDIVVKNCNNYGIINGKSGIGGIVRVCTLSR